MLKGAFIGFGNVAANGHLPGWRARDDVRIVAATDAAASRREAFLAACPDGRWYETVDDLLAGEKLDFVDICAPAGQSCSADRTRARRGSSRAERKAAGHAGRRREAYGEGGGARRARPHTVHNWLEAPICQKVSALIDDGAIGAVRSVRWRTLRTQPAIAVSAEGVTNWRVDPGMAGGGILFDHGWHALYCVMRWAGIPVGVAARLETRRFHEHPLEDTASIELDTAAGVSTIFLTWAAEERANTIEIEGEEGEIRVVGDAVVLKSNAQERRWSCPPSLSEGSHHPDWFGGVAADFMTATMCGGKGNLDEAILCARLIDAAQRSSAAGGVRLPLA